MSRVKEKPRYYIIRAEVVWGIILGVVILFIVVLCGKNCTESIKETAMEQENRRESVNVTFEGVKSTLTDVGQCYLCGNSRRSLMGYYRKFDTIGLISLNDWYVLDFPLKNYDSKGNEVIGDNSDNSTHGNTGEIMYSRSGTVSRGMARIDVTLPEDYKLNMEILQENLCQECLDKVTESLEYWKWEDEEKRAIPLCLVDFETLEIHPVQNMYTAYFIKDYWVELDSEENEIRIEAFYLPER
jgi:hypothetical protein